MHNETLLPEGLPFRLGAPSRDLLQFEFEEKTIVIRSSSISSLELNGNCITIRAGNARFEFPLSTANDKQKEATLVFGKILYYLSHHAWEERDI